jgi:hypothetical protein
VGIRDETLVDERTLCVFSQWRDEIDAGLADYSALMAMRHRLRTGEFEAGPDRDTMILTVQNAIAAAVRVDVELLPDAPGLDAPWR